MFSKSRVNEPGPQADAPQAPKPPESSAPKTSTDFSPSQPKAKPPASVLSSDLTIKGNLRTTGDIQIEGAHFDNLPEDLDWNARRKLDTLKRLAQTSSHRSGKRIVLKFMTAPVEILGDSKVTGLKTVSKTATGKQADTIDAGLIFRSVGYRGAALPGLPFDEARCIIPNARGRVIDQDTATPGIYVTGWIKRGPRGVIGTNKKCALETVQCLLEDSKAGRLERGEMAGESLETLLDQRKPGWVAMGDWKRIDKRERSAGADQGRHRVKMTSWDKLLEAAAG